MNRLSRSEKDLLYEALLLLNEKLLVPSWPRERQLELSAALDRLRLTLLPDNEDSE